MPYAIIADERIFYTRHEGGPPGQRVLLCIHGAGGDHLHWPPGVRRLPGADVYALDLPGHGRSSGTGRTTIPAYRDFVLSFMDALALPRAVLMGHSMGSAIALECALYAPQRVEALILVGSGARLRVTPLILEGLLTDFSATVDLICQYAYGPAASEFLRQRGRERMAETSPQVLHGDFLACDAFDVMARLGEIQCPTLIITGTADKLTPPKYATYLGDHIPDAQVVLVEEAGHMVMLERPELFTKKVTAFLETL